MIHREVGLALVGDRSAGHQVTFVASLSSVRPGCGGDDTTMLRAPIAKSRPSVVPDPLLEVGEETVRPAGPPSLDPVSSRLLGSASMRAILPDA